VRASLLLSSQLSLFVKGPGEIRTRKGARHPAVSRRTDDDKDGVDTARLKPLTRARARARARGFPALRVITARVILSGPGITVPTMVGELLVVDE